MFWQFNYQSSEIENLLNREDVTLLLLLNEDDILQECKAQNKRLIDFLAEENNIRSLVDFIVDEPDSNLDPKVQYKLPVRACEILISNIASLNDGLITNNTILIKLLSYIDTTGELNPLQASLFAKLFQHLTTACPQQMLEKMDGKFLGLLMSHIATSAIMDTILHIATLDSYSQWMIDNEFLEKLINTFSREHSREEVENACWIMIELMKRWRDVTLPPPTSSTTHLFAIHIQQENTCLRILDLMLESVNEWSIAAGLMFFIHILNQNQVLSTEIVENEVITEGICNALSARWPQIHQLLIQPPKQSYCPMLTTWGLLRLPVGRVRILIIQLVTMVIKLNMDNLNNQLQQLNTIAIILDLYFEYVWNNLLHAQVEACIHALLNVNNYQAIEQIFSNYKLLQKIMSIFKENEKGLGVAYFGHLTNISNSLQEHLQHQQELQQQNELHDQPLYKTDCNEDWKLFVETDLSRINSINNTQLISGWEGGNDSLGNTGTNEFNFESDIGCKFGFVEDGSVNRPLDIESADVFEALCSHNHQSIDDMFGDVASPQHPRDEAESIFPTFGASQPVDDLIDSNDQPDEWANFGEIETHNEFDKCINMQQTSDMQLADTCDKQTEEGWANFDNIENNDSQENGTSVDSS